MEKVEDVLGLGLSAGFKFNPEDDELLEYYLLPRLLGQQLPLEGMIFEDDPLSAPPWELVDKHKPKANEAFFFANGQSIHSEGGRQRRSCVGGTWKGEKPLVDGDRLRVLDGGSGMESEITWKKYMLSFHLDGQKGSTGWVMHEYSITAPMDVASSSLRLYRVRFGGHGENAKREPDDYARARAERDLLQEQTSASNSVFPRVDLLQEQSGSAPSCSDQDYQCQYQYQYQHQHQQYSCQDSFFLSGADYGGASTHQDLVDGSRMNLGAHSAAPSSVQGQGAPGVIDAAAPEWMLPQFGQESFDESFMDFELPENVDELLSFLGPCGSEAPLYDQLM